MWHITLKAKVNEEFVGDGSTNWVTLIFKNKSTNATDKTTYKMNSINVVCIKNKNTSYISYFKITQLLVVYILDNWMNCNTDELVNWT